MRQAGVPVQTGPKESRYPLSARLGTYMTAPNQLSWGIHLVCGTSAVSLMPFGLLHAQGVFVTAPRRQAVSLGATAGSLMVGSSSLFVSNVRSTADACKKAVEAAKTKVSKFVFSINLSQ